MIYNLYEILARKWCEKFGILWHLLRFAQDSRRTSSIYCHHQLLCHMTIRDKQLVINPVSITLDHISTTTDGQALVLYDF